MFYHILLLPLLAGLVVQVIKLLIHSNKQKFDLSGLVSYSGMPSAHSATIVALAAIVGLEEGVSSPLFAICIVLAIIVIRDALGIRRYLGQHGKVLNILVKDLGDDHVLDRDYPTLLERVGHTPAQVIVGSLIGLVIAVLGYIFLN